MAVCDYERLEYLSVTYRFRLCKDRGLWQRIYPNQAIYFLLPRMLKSLTSAPRSASMREA